MVELRLPTYLSAPSVVQILVGTENRNALLSDSSWWYNWGILKKCKLVSSHLFNTAIGSNLVLVINSHLRDLSQMESIQSTKKCSIRWTPNCLGLTQLFNWMTSQWLAQKGSKWRKTISILKSWSSVVVYNACCASLDLW